MVAGGGVNVNLDTDVNTGDNTESDIGQHGSQTMNNNLSQGANSQGSGNNFNFNATNTGTQGGTQNAK